MKLTADTDLRLGSPADQNGSHFAVSLNFM